VLMVGLFQGDSRFNVLTQPNDGTDRIVLGRIRVRASMGLGCGG
jgi:hypothetical protein